MQRKTAESEPSLDEKKIAFIKKQKEIIQDIFPVFTAYQGVVEASQLLDDESSGVVKLGV